MEGHSNDHSVVQGPRRRDKIRQRILLAFLGMVVTVAPAAGYIYNQRISEREERVRSIARWTQALYEGDGYGQVCLPCPPIDAFSVSGVSSNDMLIEPEGFAAARKYRKDGLMAMEQHFRRVITGAEGTRYNLPMMLNAAIDHNATELLPTLLELDDAMTRMPKEKYAPWEPALVMTTIASILRMSEYPPLMQTDLGKSGKIPYIWLKDVTTFPLTPEWRTRIRGWAADFTRENPDFDGATKMLPETYER